MIWFYEANCLGRWSNFLGEMKQIWWGNEPRWWGNEAKCLLPMVMVFDATWLYPQNLQTQPSTLDFFCSVCISYFFDPFWKTTKLSLDLESENVLCEGVEGMSCHVIPCKTMIYHAIPSPTMSYHATPCHTMFYNVIQCHTMSYNIIPYSTISYNVIPCHTCNTM